MFILLPRGKLATILHIHLTIVLSSVGGARCSITVYGCSRIFNFILPRNEEQKKQKTKKLLGPLKPHAKDKLFREDAALT